MIPFKGRSSMKQYLLLKPVKRGFKVWAMADALNGYLYDFNVYTGATGLRETGLGENIILTLSESVKGKHHQLYFNNFFTSFTLLEKLLSQGTYGCGTIRTNRKTDEAKKFKCGEYTFRQCSNIVAIAWKNNKVVNVASTLADLTEHTTVKRMQKDGSRIEVHCSILCFTVQYVHGGVDHSNQLRGSYHVRLKCTKNYKYIFWFMFDVSITNTLILHSFDVTCGTAMHFRLRLAEQLIGTYTSRKRPGRPRKRPQRPSSSISIEHFPTRSTKRRWMYC